MQTEPCTKCLQKEKGASQQVSSPRIRYTLNLRKPPCDGAHSLAPSAELRAQGLMEESRASGAPLP